MKKILIATIGLLIGTGTFAQSFHSVGPQNTEVATNVSEMDFKIENGVPYVFYVSASTNKGTVKKWDGTAWVNVGAPDFTASNPFDIDLEVDGNNVYVAYKFVSGGGTAGERLNVHRSLNGAAWGGMASYDYPSFGPGVMTCDHGRPYSLEVKYGMIRLAFFDQLDQDEFKYCNWNNGSSYFEPIASGLNLWDDDNDAVITELDVHIDDDGNEWYAASIIGMGFESNLYRRSGTSWANEGDIWGLASAESNKGVLIESYWDLPGDYIQLSVGAIRDNVTQNLYHAMFWNDPTPGWDNNYMVQNGGTLVTEFDMATNGSETFYYYKENGITYLQESDRDGSDVSNWNEPGTAGLKSNLKVETKPNGRPVIAYIQNGDVFVMEEWNPVSFNMSDPEMCSGTTETFTGHITVSSQNLDNTDLTWDVTPDQLAVMHTANVSGSFPDYDLTLGNYFQASNVNVEINVEIFDEFGSLDNDNQYTVLVKANDSVASYLTNNQICLNHGPANLMDFVSPQGGIFQGPIQPNGVFNPMLAGTGNHGITYSIFNQSSGCFSSISIPVTVMPAPSASVITTDAACNDSTGTATVTASGGVGPYTYYWSTGADSLNLADLPSGQYFVQVTDNNGCMATGVANVGNLSVNLVANVTGVNCPDDNNGSIDLTVAGVGPFDILWSNGYGTEDITALVPGFYDVTVTDANGCTGTGTYEVTGPSEFQISAVKTNAGCAASDGTITLTVSGGDGNYTYQWYDENNTAIGTNSNAYTSASGGLYTCEITDGNGCMTTWTGVVNENGAPVVTINSVTNASCSNDGAIDMSYTTAATLDYIDWSNGASTEDISNLAPGTYAVWVVDQNGCTGMGEATVYASAPETPQICVVTVDSITTSNVVVWEKPVTSDISHYNIYREGSQAGQYMRIDSVLYSEDSEYNDLVASPMVRSWRYKISAVDNCGNESALSDYHKTIHATINLGLGGNINLLWDAYEGLTYTSISCWRNTDVNGFELLWTNPSTQFSFTDTPPSTTDLDYVLGFPLGTTCSSSLLKAQDYNGTRSNRSAGIFNGSGLGLDENEVTDFAVMVFPNPSNGNFQVRLTGTANGQFEYQILDVRGRVILKGTKVQRQFDMDLSSLESGIYYMNIQNNGTMKTEKLIIK